MKLPLTYYGNPVLRKKAAKVEKINDDVRTLVHDMIETMEAHNGLGLAAPQVNRSLAIFIIQVPIQNPDETFTPGPLKVFINPKIIAYSEETWDYVEGCLSIPGVYENVTRPYKVTITALNLDGEEFTEDFTELEAHAVMHENDHINGVLFIDRLPPKKKKEMETPLRNIKKKLN